MVKSNGPSISSHVIHSKTRIDSEKGTKPDGTLTRVPRVILSSLLFVSLAAVVLLTLELVRGRRSQEMEASKTKSLDGVVVVGVGFGGGETPSMRPLPSPQFAAELSNPFPSARVMETVTPTRSMTINQPTALPTTTTSIRPTVMPTQDATTETTEYLLMSLDPISSQVQVTTFYAIGDVPYNAQQSSMLTIQMDSIPMDAEFVIHVGDIRSGKNKSIPCQLSDYQDVADILKRSIVPVFIILGDNDWNDCPNPNEGLSYWHQTLQGLESRYWSHSFQIQRCPSRNETFSFVHKNTLFIGLNLVGGPVLDRNEWNTRLTDQVRWTIELMQANALPTVIFAHAEPRAIHNSFFKPFTSFVQLVWKNRLPLLHINGDLHKWQFHATFFNQSNWERITLTGGTDELPLKVQVFSAPNITSSSEAFVYDRYY